MSRHHDNLTRLLVKMRLRYGEDDEIVLELKSERESLVSSDLGRRHPWAAAATTSGVAPWQRRDARAVRTN